MGIIGLFMVSMEVVRIDSLAAAALRLRLWLALPGPDTRSIPSTASCFHSNILQVHRSLTVPRLSASNQMEG